MSILAKPEPSIESWEEFEEAQSAVAAVTSMPRPNLTESRLARWLGVIPGILLLALLAKIAITFSHWVLIPWVGCCIGLGVLVRALVPVPRLFAAGMDWDEHFQRLGVILAAGQVAAVWSHVHFAMVLGEGLAVALVLVTVYRVSRWLGITPALTGLLSIGMSVCGVTAIVAMARSVDASEEEVGAASTVILLFGLLSFATFPWIGHHLGLSELVFGAWAGLAINNTAECIASGAVYGPIAQATAVLVKALRIIFLAPAVAILKSLDFRHRVIQAGSAPLSRTDTGENWLHGLGARLKVVPSFLWVFFGMLMLTVMGAVPHPVLPLMKQGSHLLFALGFVGIGLRTSLTHLNRLPRRIWTLGLTAQVLIAVVALAAVRLIFH